MANKYASQNPSQNPDPQSEGVSGNDITHPQEQQALPDRLPKSLIEWLARINQRYLALNQVKTNDTSKFSNLAAPELEVSMKYPN